MDPALHERVKSFTLARFGAPRGGVGPDTRLAADFRIAGLDGLEFMEAYAREFRVRLPGFDWIDYFGPEGTGCLFPAILHRLLGLHDPRTSARRGRDPASFEITLRDLTLWAQAGTWTPPHLR